MRRLSLARLYFDELVESVTCIGNGSSKGGIVCGVVKGSHSDFSGPTSRSTTCIAIVPNNHVVVANAGDYHCVISRKGELIVFKLALSPVD
ncbi:hypothetical protein IFM89_015662 [Coptis chinensis]|uniref:PPM-type phosphatase domain-containing protein n=1 Tax=Coptis chinensis TaxID=261450 RepID=A0A835M2N3_9MAGN|nr:hypothetical protein IFM89_015662 [Coptis chinensis]